MRGRDRLSMTSRKNLLGRIDKARRKVKLAKAEARKLLRQISTMNLHSPTASSNWQRNDLLKSQDQDMKSHINYKCVIARQFKWSQTIYRGKTPGITLSKGYTYIHAVKYLVWQPSQRAIK